MKHTINITTTEALLINKALGFDMQNEIDNTMAERLHQQINDVVAYDLQDNRCDNCKHYEARTGSHRCKGSCLKRSSVYREDGRYGITKACKKWFERRDEDAGTSNKN